MNKDDRGKNEIRESISVATFQSPGIGIFEYILQLQFQLKTGTNTLSFSLHWSAPCC